MKSLPLISSVILLAALGGCATYVPVPKEYTGPTATLKDTGFSEDGSKAQMFAATEIDGNRMMNAFWASAIASNGSGGSLTTVFTERKVKAEPMKVKLLGSHATGAPIHAIASKMVGTFFSVEGIVDFTPQPDGIYVAKGDLKKEKSSVWIEDTATGKPATQIISQ